MKLEVLQGDVGSVDTELLVVNLFEGVAVPGGATGIVNLVLDGVIAELIKAGEITGKSSEITLIHTLGKMPARRVIILGLGRRDELSLQVISQGMGSLVRYARARNISDIVTIAHGAGIGGIDPADSARAIAEGACLGAYRFTKYKTQGLENGDQSLTIIDNAPNKIAPLTQGMRVGQVLAESTNIARDLGNEPANVLSPTELALRAKTVCDNVGIEFQQLDRDETRALGMGAFLSVAAGSDEPPQFIVMRYQGDPDDRENNIALCGKGITFDSGGISIKPVEGMGAMKGDMAGGAAVIGAMNAIGQIKPKINIMALVPATENMPSGSAARPADVVVSALGKTIEIVTTDAEGRLVLADAIAYAINSGYTRIVDVATLTGAASVALGNAASPIMGNDDQLIAQVVQAGESFGERFWQLPLFSDYKEQITSSVADLLNSGGRPAGTITAGYFLKEFAGDTPWVHLDIAATARTDKESGYTVKGHTGFAVRTLVKLVTDLADSPLRLNT